MPLLEKAGRRVGLAVLVGVGLGGCGGDGGPGGDATRFGARLSTMPVDAQTYVEYTGTGEVSAEVSEGRLEITGSFATLRSVASEAALHRARPGLRGEAVAALNVDAAPSGSISGSIALTPELRAALLEGELYVKISSGAHPDGELRGWLFPR